jgi:uncharacterized protein (UPF0332 family)
VKPQTGLFLDKARQQLQRADAMLGIGLHDDAGRAAYLAGLHVAQALIFEITDTARKRHSGVQREFARLVKDDPRFDPQLRAFLPQTYNLKAIADYETGSAQVSAESARNAIAAARRFVDCVTALIPQNGHAPRAADTTKH